MRFTVGLTRASLLSLAFASTFAFADEFNRSTMSDRFWVEAAAGISPDSGMFQGEPSAVAARREVSLRYQHGVFGVLVNYHYLEFDSELDQEAYKVNNSVFAGGFTMRIPFGDKGGFFGESHLIAHILGQTGRSDFHYYEGPAGGAKTEVTADILKAGGFGAGIDFYFPAIFGLWFFGGGGFESNSFDYKITSDPNNDGKVNIRKTFTFARVGIGFSI